METILAGKSIDKVFVDKAVRSSLYKELMVLIRQQQIPCSHVPAVKLNKLTTKNHQGAVA